MVAWFASTAVATILIAGAGVLTDRGFGAYEVFGVLVFCVAASAVGVVVLGPLGLLFLVKERLVSGQAYGIAGAVLGAFGVLVSGVFGGSDLLRLAPVGAIAGATAALSFRAVWKWREATV